MASSRGKKIDTWWFTIDTVRVGVPVYLMMDGNQAEFKAKSEEYELSLRNKDINVLKVEVEKLLKASLSIKWEKFIYVQYTGSGSVPYGATNKRRKFDATSNLGIDGSFTIESKLEYSIVEVATRKDGQKVHRFFNTRQYGRSARDGMPDVGVEKDNWDDGVTTSALIPYTQENMEGLCRIREKFLHVNKMLRELMKPKKIQGLVDSARGGRLLLGSN